MKFIKRTTAPTKDNKYYGKPDPFINSGYGMFQCNGNCTDYAWCRYREAQEDMNGSKNISTRSAYNWYKDAVKNGLPIGSVAKIGAIAVFGKPEKKKGHVAIVESVDGINITYSSSAYKKYLFKTRKIKQAQKWGNNLDFIGYIYNEEFENDKSFKDGKDYKILKSKILRKSAKVKTNNKLKVKDCDKSIQKLLTSKKPNDVAKIKVGKKIKFKKYVSDTSGNTWGLIDGNTINTWICVCDSTGNQIK